MALCAAHASNLMHLLDWNNESFRKQSVFSLYYTIDITRNAFFEAGKPMRSSHL